MTEENTVTEDLKRQAALFYNSTQRSVCVLKPNVSKYTRMFNTDYLFTQMWLYSVSSKV